MDLKQTKIRDYPYKFLNCDSQQLNKKLIIEGESGKRSGGY